MQNKALLREKKMKVVEDKLAQAVDEARLLGITRTELEEMLGLLYRENK